MHDFFWFYNIDDVANFDLRGPIESFCGRSIVLHGGPTVWRINCVEVVTLSRIENGRDDFCKLRYSLVSDAAEEDGNLFQNKVGGMLEFD